MKKISIVFLLMFASVLSLTSCEVHFGQNSFDVPWWVIAVPVLFITIIIMVMVQKDIIGNSYSCPQCGECFKPKWYEFSAWLHINDSRVVRCPKCGRKGFCKPKE